MTKGIKLKVWGELACFTRPEMKAERVSYDIITPSAARGIVEAIYWKKEIRWVIDRIRVLNDIQFTNVRRNEVGGKIPMGKVKSAMNSGSGQLGLYIEEDRQQRASTILKNVRYILEAHFEILSGENNSAKHFEIFQRRATKGQSFHQPCFGCREFPADFEWFEGEFPTCHENLKGTQDLGWMLHDIDFSNNNTARFFRAKMVDGVIEVPAFLSSEVKA